MANVIFSKGAFIEGQDTSEVRGRVREGCEKLLVCRWFYCINDDGSGNDSVCTSAMDKVPSFLSRLMTTSSSSRGSKLYSVLVSVVIVFFENCRCSEIL